MPRVWFSRSAIFPFLDVLVVCGGNTGRQAPTAAIVFNYLEALVLFFYVIIAT